MSMGVNPLFGSQMQGYGAYMTGPGGVSGLGRFGTQDPSMGMGGVFQVDPYTGQIRRMGQGQSYSRYNPAYGMAGYNTSEGGGYNAPWNPAAHQSYMGAMQQWAQKNPGAGSAIDPNDPELMRITQDVRQLLGNNQRNPGAVDKAVAAHADRLAFERANPGYSVQSGMGGGYSTPGMPGGGGGGWGGGLEGLAAMGQRRLGEQASEQNERLAEDYQRRGLTQSGLLSEAQARQTRDQGYALSDFLAQLYGRGMMGGGMYGMNSLSASSRPWQAGQSNPQQDLQQAYMQQLMQMGLSSDMIAQLGGLLGGGGGGDYGMDFSSWY